MSSFLQMLMKNGGVERLERLLTRMKSFEQRKYMNAIIACVARQYLSFETASKKDAPVATSTVIGAAAGLIHALIKDNDVLKEHLVSSLTRSTIPVLDESLSARRSVIAALAKDHGEIHGGWSRVFANKL